MFSCKQGQTSGSNITKKMFWWNNFCNNYRDHYKNHCSKELFCNGFGQDGNQQGKIHRRVSFGEAQSTRTAKFYATSGPASHEWAHECDHESTYEDARGQKKHINFFNINFLAPTQNTRFWAPRKKLMCLISWERKQKKGPT